MVNGPETDERSHQTLDSTGIEANSTHTPPDPRGSVPCRFFTNPRGCRNDLCPFLHVLDGQEAGDRNVMDPDLDDIEGHELDDDFTREFSGASVSFNELGQVSKISLPADFSLACITGFTSGATPVTVVETLHILGFNIDVDCVRITTHSDPSEMKAMVKVEDPLFANKLCTKLKDGSSTLNAIPVPINSRQANYRKVYISWHKPTRSVWLNFGNGGIADRVAAKFNSGGYKCLGQPVRATTTDSRLGRRGRGGYPYNPLAWTATLSNVPGHATSVDIQEAIKASYDKPRHVEMGEISYTASDPDVSVTVRSRLEKYGPLESFYLAASSKGKRVKATAWFQDESDAKSACSLNNEPLDILKRGKLTVTLIQSMKVKVPTAIYRVSKARLDQESMDWKELHLAFNVYTDTLNRFTTLKIEGEVPKDVAAARKKLDEIVSGGVLMEGQNVVWDTTLGSNGRAYRNLKAVEDDLCAVIVRDKAKRQLRYYGPPEYLEQCASRITRMLKEAAAATTTYQIDLNPNQFSWAIRGGFKNIEKALGKRVAIFDVVSRKITMNGTQQQYEMAVALVDGKRPIESCPQTDDPPALEGDCPICFCEAENPIQTSCKHTYCQECFEECCKSAASTSKTEFQVKCQGDEGNCTAVFKLRELKDHLSSSVLESVLQSSFEEYIQRHPESLRYCPTPDCGSVYRSTTTLGSNPPVYTCSNCFEPLCTSCHARHGNYTCAEYKEIASGGYEALEKLKKELNIKDCPKCSTPMEKTEGCNHMTCGGCKAHICWVCMAVFESSEPCYNHMTKKHGGIGLGRNGL
ncbi:hypothetical protein K458DRAFT_441534 [Lentithecium fluviatile CBS 122367]|uniref:Uncharacterized protein n=1 Tax=Lentithecium fluviatile CBS 122367 TaxID=1168545 RepID=A0A6G1J9H8_9PLEO|nr:hypothetical protein K458DRAFT_441534 [Lentithecium fluviatile CBS 122367]